MIPWRPIFKRFAEDYGWGPERVLSLTFYQIRMYIGDRQSEKPHHSRVAAERHRERIKQQHGAIANDIVSRVMRR